MNSPHLYTFINQKPDSRRAWSYFSIPISAANRGSVVFHVSFSLKALPFQGFQLTSSDLSLFGLSEKSFVCRSGSLRTIYRNSLFSFRQFYHLYPKHRLSPHYETAENSRTDIWIINHCFFHPPDRSTVKTSYFHCLFFSVPFVLFHVHPMSLLRNALFPHSVSLIHYYLPPKPGVSGPGRFPPGIPPGSLTGDSDPITVIVDDIVNEVSRLSPP